MGLYLIDTYLFVLMVIQEICSGNYILSEQNLVVSLH